MHPHHHGPVDGPASRARTVVRWILGVVAVATLVGAVVLWPGSRTDLLVDTALDIEQLDATVTDVEVSPCEGGDPAFSPDCETLGIHVTSGPTAGTDSSIVQTFDQRGIHVEPGDRIVVARTPGAPEGFEYAFVDFQRHTPLLILAGLFVLAVLLLSRLQGLRALAGAAASMVVLVVFLLPTLLAGSSPMFAAVVAASIIAFLAIYLTHGINDQATVALLGTLASLALVAVVALIFVGLCDFTGLVNTEATVLQITAGQVDLNGVLLAGIVIGSLGVLDDVTVTQVSAVWELRAANPTESPRAVYTRAIRIGRDHIASTVNTLVLAYAGASLPLLLLFTQSTQPLRRVLTGELVAIEIVRTLVGSIGLVASVPITTALAVLLVGASREEPSATMASGVDSQGMDRANEGDGEGEIGLLNGAPE